MAPSSKVQPKPAKSASGHTKRQHVTPAPASVPTAIAPASRQHVVPAIPLALMNKQPDGTRNTAAKPSHKHAPTVTTSSNGFPVSSLEAALISPSPLHSVKTSENEVKIQNVEKPTPPGLSPSKREERHEQQPQPSPPRVNGVDYATTEPTSGSDRVAEAARGELYPVLISSRASNQVLLLTLHRSKR